MENDDSSQSQSSTEDLGDSTGVERQSGKIMCQGGHSSYIGMNVCGSVYENGCVVGGMCSTAADRVLLLAFMFVVKANVHVLDIHYQYVGEFSFSIFLTLGMLVKPQKC